MTVTQDEQAGREPTAPGQDPVDPDTPVRGATDRWLVRGLYALTLVPLALVAAQAVRAPRMHVLLDYWHVLAKVTEDDGSLIWRQVFSYHLEQPFVVPSLIFWGDARFFGGDNRVLTVLAVVLVAAIVVMLRLMLPAGMEPVRKAALTAGFAFVLLTSHAAEVWAQGTNGISWTPPLFFSVLALYLSHRNRFWPAWVAAIAGCLSFGAAFPIWFVLAMVAWLRRDRLSRVVVPAAIGAATLLFWFATRPSEQYSMATSGLEPNRRLSMMAAVLGGLWSSNSAEIAIIAGGFLAAALVLLGWAVVRRRLSEPGPPVAEASWVGLGAYALAVALMLGLGRTTLTGQGAEAGLVSRYVLVGALATAAAITLVALRRPGLPVRHLVAAMLAIGLVTQAIGGLKQGNVRGSYGPLGVAAVALRVEATNTLTALQIQPAAIPAAKALGAFPFNDDFTLGCGGPELGHRIDLGATQPLPGPESVGVTKGVVDTTPVAGDTLLSGWAVVDGKHADCVLVVDGSGMVVGGGVTALARPDAIIAGEGATGWRAVARPGVTGATVVVSAAGKLYRVEAMAGGPGAAAR